MFDAISTESLNELTYWIRTIVGAAIYSCHRDDVRGRLGAVRVEVLFEISLIKVLAYVSQTNIPLEVQEVGKKVKRQSHAHSKIGCTVRCRRCISVKLIKGADASRGYCGSIAGGGGGTGHLLCAFPMSELCEAGGTSEVRECSEGRNIMDVGLYRCREGVLVGLIDGSFCLAVAVHPEPCVEELKLRKLQNSFNVMF